MTNPTVKCEWCGRQRDCLRHLRAEHPPTAAKKWLKRTCETEKEHHPDCCAGCPEVSKPCEFIYHAGVN